MVASPLCGNCTLWLRKLVWSIIFYLKCLGCGKAVSGSFVDVFKHTLFCWGKKCFHLTQTNYQPQAYKNALGRLVSSPSSCPLCEENFQILAHSSFMSDSCFSATKSVRLCDVTKRLCMYWAAPDNILGSVVYGAFVLWKSTWLLVEHGDCKLLYKRHPQL